MLDITKMLFDNAKATAEKIDEDHVMLSIGGIPVVYCEKLDMFNAAALCEEVSNTMRIDKWFVGKDANSYAERFPDFAYTRRKNTKNAPIAWGRYIHRRLFMRILGWANDQVAFDLENGIAYQRLLDERGFVYAVQPKKCLRTNVHKAGRTWQMKQRISQYNVGTKTHKFIRVFDMIESENQLLNELNLHPETFGKSTIGDEYFHCTKENMVAALERVVQKINPEDDFTPYITLLSKPPPEGSRLAKSGRFMLILVCLVQS
jgi:hypothetical protein